MNKFIYSLVAVLMFSTPVFANPTNSMSITPSASSGTTISAADENSRNNEVSTKYNAHDHQDFTLTTSNTLTIGDGNAGNKEFAFNDAAASDARFRWDGGQLQFAPDGSNYATINTTSGATVTNFQFPASPANNDLIQNISGLWTAQNFAEISDFTGAGEITYSTGATTFAVLSAGNSGQVLSSGGAAAPSWTNTTFDPTASFRFYDDFATLSQDAGGAKRVVDSKYQYIMDGAVAFTDQGLGGIIVSESDGAINPMMWLADGSGVAAGDFAHIFEVAQNPQFKMRFRVTGATTTRDGWIGLTPDASAPDGAQPTDGIYVEITSGANGFRVIVNDGGGITATASLEAIDTDWHTVEIDITSTTVDVTWDTVAATQITTNIVSGNMGFMHTNDQTTGGDGVDIDYIFVQQNR